MSFRYQAGFISALYNPLKVANAPTIGTATVNGATSVSVAFTAPADTGGGAITSYTVISSPDAVTASGASSPITVSGLTTGTPYTFTVIANNAFGPSAASAASNSATPQIQYFLYSWAENSNGQLGLGNTTYYSSPKQVGSLGTWSYFNSGRFHSLAVKTDGTLWTWGRNSQGQLGLSNTTNYSSPKQVGSLTTWLNTAGGRYYSFGITTTGYLLAWGSNYKGALGLGNTTYYSSPKQVGALSNWLKMACGTYHAVAIKTDGTLWAWGNNNFGQLGVGSSGNSFSSPVQVGALTTWSKVSCGWETTFAIKTDGTMWSWGAGANGRLGLGNTSNQNSPVQIGSLTTWLNVSGGYNFGVASKTDGTLWTWGNSNYGQLGLGNTTAYSSPKQVGVLTNWLTVRAGMQNGMAIKTDGTLWGWGLNVIGQLGLGNTTYSYSSPKQVGSQTTWVSITGWPGSFTGSIKTS